MCVMQEHTEIVDAGVEIDSHSNERVQEEVDVTRDSGRPEIATTPGLKSEILEYRVLGDDGTLVLSCPASLEVGTSQKEINRRYRTLN